MAQWRRHASTTALRSSPPLPSATLLGCQSTRSMASGPLLQQIRAGCSIAAAAGHAQTGTSSTLTLSGGKALLPRLCSGQRIAGKALGSRRCLASKSVTPEAGPVSSQDLERLVNFFLTHRNILLVTGAGCSTESNIPDYRGPNGAYTTGFKPMTHQEVCLFLHDGCTR